MQPPRFCLWGHWELDLHQLDGDILPYCLLNPLRKVVGTDPRVCTHPSADEEPRPSVLTPSNTAAVQGDAASHCMADLHPGWMGGGSTYGWVLVLGVWTMQGLGEACVWSSLLRTALEEQGGSMERDTLSGTITPKAGKALAEPGLSCPRPFSHLILVPSLSLCLPAARRSSKYLACFFWPVALYLLL